MTCSRAVFLINELSQIPEIFKIKMCLLKFPFFCLKITQRSVIKRPTDGPTDDNE